MEPYPPQFLLHPEERQATHVALTARLDGLADRAEHPLVAEMYRDAAGFYEYANSDSTATLMNDALVEHALVIDNPDMVSLALPLVHPAKRSTLVAHAAVIQAQYPNHFTNVTSDHIQRWWHGIRGTDVYAIRDQYGPMAGIQTMLAIVSAWLAIEVANATSTEGLERVYTTAHDSFFRNLAMAKEGQIFPVGPDDPSRDPTRYYVETEEFAHQAGSLGVWEPAQRLGHLGLAYLYRAGADALEPEHIDQILEHGETGGDSSYYGLLAKAALATLNFRAPQNLGRATRLYAQMSEDWLYGKAGEEDLLPYEINRFLESAGRVLQTVHPDLYSLLVNRGAPSTGAIEHPYYVNELLAAERDDAPKLLSDYYTGRLRQGDQLAAFQTALYYAQVAGQVEIEPTANPQTARLLGTVANLDTWIDTKLAAGAAMEKLSEGCMKLSRALSSEELDNFHDTAGIVAGQVSIADSMQRYGLLSNEDVMTIVKRAHPSFTTLRTRKSQIDTVNGILSTIKQLAAEHPGEPIQYLLDLKFHSSNKTPVLIDIVSDLI